MEKKYDVSLTKYELNTLISAVRETLKKEKVQFENFCKSNDMFAADLQSSTVTQLYTLLGKLTAIPQEAD